MSSKRIVLAKWSESFADYKTKYFGRRNKSTKKHVLHVNTY